MTVPTAGPTILQPSAVRKDADHPVDAAHLALHSRPRCVAGSPDDPRRRQLEHHHEKAGAHARARKGGDGRLGRSALEPRAWYLLSEPVLRRPADAQAAIPSRGRRGRVGQRGRAARRAGLVDGHHWDVDRCRAQSGLARFVLHTLTIRSPYLAVN